MLCCQGFVSFAIFWIGWYGPKVLLHHDILLHVGNLDVASTKRLYQVTSSGDIILDGTLNRPLITDVTVPCEWQRRIEKKTCSKRQRRSSGDSITVNWLTPS